MILEPHNAVVVVVKHPRLPIAIARLTLALGGLKAEQEKLKPVVETNRGVIDAILDLQYQKSRSDVWKDRWLGLGNGILTSIIASILYGFSRRLVKRKKSTAVEQSPAPPAG